MVFVSSGFKVLGSITSIEIPSFSKISTQSNAFFTSPPVATIVISLPVFLTDEDPISMFYQKIKYLLCYQLSPLKKKDLLV